MARKLIFYLVELDNESPLKISDDDDRAGIVREVSEIRQDCVDARRKLKLNRRNSYITREWQGA